MKFNPLAGIARYYKSEVIKKAVNNLDLDHPLESNMDAEWKPLLQKLHHKNLVKDELESMRREFSANVSHELKTPLTSISGYSELLSSGMVEGDMVENFAGKIHGESKRLLNLIEDVIRISRLDERGLEMEKEEVDLFAITRDICSRLSYQIEAKNIQLKLTGKSVNVFGVKSVLDEMLYNICENAVKYNIEAGSLDIWVGSTLEGPQIIVMDTGVGIPEEEQDRVFERFYRVDKSHSKELQSNNKNEMDTSGTGLGLSIVKNGARIHNAEVALESIVGLGTKISVRFNK